MSFVRRSFVALTGLFLLQLTLLGSGTLCAVEHRATRDAPAEHVTHSAMHSMSGMKSAIARVSVATISDLDNPTKSDCGGPDQHDGCSQPWAPGQCSSMMPCDISATPAGSIEASVTMGTTAHELPAPALIRSGPTFAPEIPPPRA